MIFLSFKYETYSNVCITTLMCMKYLYSMHIINRKFNNDIWLVDNGKYTSIVESDTLIGWQLSGELLNCLYELMGICCYINV